jgi:hypothetical protein
MSRVMRERERAPVCARMRLRVRMHVPAPLRTTRMGGHSYIYTTTE